MMQFFRTRQWVIARRLILLGIVIMVAYRQYGDSLVLWLQGPNPTADIAITQAEFRPELPGSKPAWIIGFRNDSTKFTYDDIQLEAVYIDAQGQVLETDKLVVKQKLTPGEEKMIGSADFKTRGSATRGTLRVLGAQGVR